jgi:hypothetical protein
MKKYKDDKYSKTSCIKCVVCVLVCASLLPCQAGSIELESALQEALSVTT